MEVPEVAVAVGVATEPALAVIPGTGTLLYITI